MGRCGSCGGKTTVVKVVRSHAPSTRIVPVQRPLVISRKINDLNKHRA